MLCPLPKIFFRFAPMSNLKNVSTVPVPVKNLVPYRYRYWSNEYRYRYRSNSVPADPCASVQVHRHRRTGRFLLHRHRHRQIFGPPAPAPTPTFLDFISPAPAFLGAGAGDFIYCVWCHFLYQKCPKGIKIAYLGVISVKIFAKQTNFLPKNDRFDFWHVSTHWRF